MLAFIVLIVFTVFGDAFGNPYERCRTDSSWTIENTTYTPIQYNGFYFIYVQCKFLDHYPDPPHLVKCIGNYPESSMPRCKKSDGSCRRISSPVYGSMTCDSNPPRPGTTCRFSCLRGYYLKGSQIRTCNNTNWTGNMTTCVPKVECPSGSYLAHGDVVDCSRPPLAGETCTYKCYEGYKLVGNQQLKCSKTAEMTNLRGRKVSFSPYCRSLQSCGNANGGCAHKCRQNQTLLWCECPPGLILQSDRKKCKDENECQTGNHHCHQKCINTFPGYRCECEDGYKLIDEHHCEGTDSDDDASQEQPMDRTCARRNGDCSHECSQRADGAVVCSCHPGFELGADGKSCVVHCPLSTYRSSSDLSCKRCPANSHTLDEGRVSLEDCICDAGFLGHPARNIPCKPTRTAIPERDPSAGGVQEPHVDRSAISCALRNGGCAQICSEKEGGTITCSCSTGFKLERDGKSCVDINECTLNNHGCSQKCQNLQGSAKCLCSSGYILSEEDKKICLDVDECSSRVLNKCEQNCHNTEGNYTCSCDEGYLLFKDFKCQACRLHSYWLNSSCIECPPHSYTLSEGQTSLANCFCRPGFEGNPGQNKPCLDINECLDNNFGCSHDCLNSLGSAMCSCPKGFELESDLKTCRDIDECSVKNGGCQENCHNQEGGFYCSCSTGFTLSNKYFCEDVNECEENNGNCSDTCINVRGGYHCSCPSGYHVDRGGQKCRALLCPEFVIPNDAKVVCFPKDSPSEKTIFRSGKQTEAEDMRFPPNTICRAVCEKGFTEAGTWANSAVICDEEGNWNASINLGCRGLQCSPLFLQDPAMQVHPSECSLQPMAVHSVCHISCPTNYRLHGRARFTCNKTLQWFKQEAFSACLPVNPFLTCPEDINLSLQGLNNTLALGIVPLPDSNVAHLVKHQPKWVEVNTPSLFPVGKTQVTFMINETRVNISLSCAVRVTVIDDIPPVFDSCPESIQVEADDFYGVQVWWREPLANDNVAVHSILKTLEPNTTLPPGVHSVKYVAKDAAGNEAECAFEINVLTSGSECGELEDPVNGEANCMELLTGVFCEPVCDDNYVMSEDLLGPYICNSTGKWSPSKIIPPCVPECEEGATWSEDHQQCEIKTFEIDLGRNAE